MAEKDLNIYLTGVANEGDTQNDPNQSLGGKRSGTIVKSLSASAPVAVTGVTIDEVPAPSGEGSATLAFTYSGTTLTYTAPGDTTGATVNVSTDGTYELYSGDATKYIIVTVTSVSLPASDQSDAITLTNVVEGIFDSVGSGEAVGGDTEYRALMLRNDSAYGMSNVKVWIESNTPFTNDSVEIGIETPSLGDIQSIANEDTTPSGITFYPAASEAAALSIGTLSASGNYGIWIRRVVTATALRYADNNFQLAFKADTA